MPKLSRSQPAMPIRVTQRQSLRISFRHQSKNRNSLPPMRYRPSCRKLFLMRSGNFRRAHLRGNRSGPVLRSRAVNSTEPRKRPARHDHELRIDQFTGFGANSDPAPCLNLSVFFGVPPSSKWTMLPNKCSDKSERFAFANCNCNYNSVFLYTLQRSLC